MTGAGHEPNDREACQAQCWALGSAAQQDRALWPYRGKETRKDAEMNVRGLCDRRDRSLARLRGFNTCTHTRHSERLFTFHIKLTSFLPSFLLFSLSFADFVLSFHLFLYHSCLTALIHGSYKDQDQGSFMS